MRNDLVDVLDDDGIAWRANDHSYGSMRKKFTFEQDQGTSKDEIFNKLLKIEDGHASASIVDTGNPNDFQVFRSRSMQPLGQSRPLARGLSSVGPAYGSANNIDSMAMVSSDPSRTPSKEGDAPANPEAGGFGSPSSQHAPGVTKRELVRSNSSNVLVKGHKYKMNYRAAISHRCVNRHHVANRMRVASDEATQRERLGSDGESQSLEDLINSPKRPSVSPPRRYISQDRLHQIDAEVFALISSVMLAFFYTNAGLFDIMHELVENMKRVVLGPNEVVLTQGERGDLMFILQSGAMVVERDGVEVDQIGPGQQVGELALLYNEARSATVRTTTNCVLWSLDRETFQTVQAAQALESRTKSNQYLHEAQCLSSLRGYHQRKLGSTMKRVQFLNGEKIVTEGDAISRCYIVESGVVAISSESLSAEELATKFPVPNKVPYEPALSPKGEHKMPPLPDGAMVATEGFFLGRQIVAGAAGLEEGSDPFDEETHTSTSSTTMTAIGAVWVSYFDLSTFEAVLGPIKDVLSAGIDDDFGSGIGVRELGPVKGLSQEDFEELAFLGEGAYGKVILAKCIKQDCRLYGKEYAIKSLSKKQVVEQNHVAQVASERDMLIELHHPFVLGMEASFQCPDAVYLVTDYVKSVTLFEILYPAEEAFAIPEELMPLATRFWAANITEAIVHVHNQGVAYRDLKPENLLVNEQGYIILIDLGFAKKLPYTEVDQDGFEIHHDMTYTLCGTFEYLAPEFFYDGHGHTHAVDYWALGCIVHEMVMGKTPFVDFPGEQDLRKLFLRICKTQYKPVEFDPSFDEHAAISGEEPGACRQLCSELLKSHPTERLGNLAGGAKGITEHPYFAAFDWVGMREKEMPAPWLPPTELFSSVEKDLLTHDSELEEYGGDPGLFADW